MAWQSCRLLSMGYYDKEEEPRLSYKETPFRVFRRKRGRRRSGAGTVAKKTSPSPLADDVDHPLPQDGGDKNSFWTRFSPKTVAGLLFVILMCFGGCSYIMYDSSRTGVDQSSGWLENMGWAGNDLGKMQAQLTKLQDDMAGVDVKMMQMQLKELQDELFGLTKKLLPVADTMPNFALESQGANVLHHLTSQTYYTQPPLVTFWGIPLWYPPANPRTVIQGHSSPLTPGHCWAFAGRRGHLLISLSHPVTITHVTLGHISSMQSTAGFAYSAPREFSVYGIKTASGETTRLGTFVYDPNGESLQTFKLPDHTKGVFRFVKLQIESNWGHPEYTCVYNFRVHGKMPLISVTP
ncbi:SUN domain-containing protein 3-like [Thunnus albacares]|uniref:SUN domain-containing protein 3-like n=1 Tax=Thunnus albacares TaxID=8236 RepID=UPI001CF60B41|nr:SUN domain-containing protein 3-like [Thunnus albacares]